MTPFTWRDDSAFQPTHQPCWFCNDTQVITYDDDAVECPLHGGPLAKIPTSVAKRIQANVERELGIRPSITVTARGWLLAGAAAIVLWVLILGAAVVILRALS